MARPYAFAATLMTLAMALLSALPSPADAAAQPDAKATDLYDHTVMLLELNDPVGAKTLVSCIGAVTVDVLFDGPAFGDADDGDMNGLEEVALEMPALDLAGFAPGLGTVRFRLDSISPGLGQIEEIANNTPGRLDLPPFSPTGSAQVYLDAILDLEFLGQNFVTYPACRIQGTFSHEPCAPGDFLTASGLVGLNDESGQPTGWSVRIIPCRLAPPVEVDPYPHTVMMIQLRDPLGGTEMVQFKGSSTAEVFFEGSEEGSAGDDDNDGLDEVASRLVAMDLAGISSGIGPMRVRLQADQPATGGIEENIGNNQHWLDLPPFAPTGTAESFFDIFFEIEVPGMILLTHAPHRISGTFHHKPAALGDWLTGSPEVELYDQNGNPTGWRFLVDMCRLNPPLEIDYFDQFEVHLEIRDPTGSPEIVPLAGWAVQEVLFAGALLGAADDDDQNGRDEVASEMTGMELVGVSPLQGPILLRLGAGAPSLGLIEENVNNTPAWLDLPPFAMLGTAESTHQLFLEIEMNGQTLHNGVPHEVSGTITHKPAGPTDVLAGSDAVNLLDESGNRTGWSLRFVQMWPGRIATGVGGDTLPPRSGPVIHAAPNPFNPRLRIAFRMDEAGPAQLTIHDLRGRLMVTLLQETRPAGKVELFWNGRDAAGRAAASGTYLLRLETKQGRSVRKVGLVR